MMPPWPALEAERRLGGRQAFKCWDIEQIQRVWYNAKILAGEANINTEMLAGKVNMIAKILARLADMNGAEIFSSEIRPLLWLRQQRLLQETLARQCLCFSIRPFPSLRLFLGIFIFISFIRVDGGTVEETAGLEKRVAAADTQRDVQRQRQTFGTLVYFYRAFSFLIARPDTCSSFVCFFLHE